MGPRVHPNHDDESGVFIDLVKDESGVYITSSSVYGDNDLLDADGNQTRVYADGACSFKDDDWQEVSDFYGETPYREHVMLDAQGVEVFADGDVTDFSMVMDDTDIVITIECSWTTGTFLMPREGRDATLMEEGLEIPSEGHLRQETLSHRDEMQAFLDSLLQAQNDLDGPYDLDDDYPYDGGIPF
jgi:hypothetical protein